MGIIYTISNYLGYFLVMLIFLALAIVFAKTKAAWVLFTAGAGLQLISLIGTQKSFNMWGMGHKTVYYWLIYVLLIFVGMGLITKRRNKADDARPEWEEPGEEYPELSIVVHSEGWTCTCGRSHQSYETTCVCGVSKNEIK